MSSLPEALAEAGIHLHRHDRGEHRSPCPECARGKPRPGDDALAVLIDADGATWLCHRCGFKGGTREDSGERPRWKRGTRPVDPATTAARERKRELARTIWRQTEPIADGSLAAAYLIERRRISRWDPDRLRWHPACPWPAGAAGCIVAPVTAPTTGEINAIWRIRPVLEGKVERRGLGPVRGGAARLFQVDGPELVVAEGVEDALAAHALFGLPAWAALSAGGMAGLILPTIIRHVLILADRDEPLPNGRRPGLDSAHELARRLRAEGRVAEVRWARSHKDPNEVLQGRIA